MSKIRFVDDFHAATAPPPLDLADRFVKAVIEERPDWIGFLMAIDEGDPNGRVFRVPGPVRNVEIIFVGTYPGNMLLTWQGGHFHYGFDWHVEPTVETVTREMIVEAELQMRGEGEEGCISRLDFT